MRFGVRSLTVTLSGSGLGILSGETAVHPDTGTELPVAMLSQLKILEGGQACNDSAAAQAPGTGPH